MSGPNGPNNPDERWAGPQQHQSGQDASGQAADEAREDATRRFDQPQPSGQQWGQQPSQQQPNQQWGQQPTQQQPTQQQWGQPGQGQPWGQQPGQQQPNQQWGQQPTQQQPTQQQWGQPGQGQPWGQQPTQQQPYGQQWGQPGQQPYSDAQQQYPPQYQGAYPQGPGQPKKKSKLPLILGILGVLVLVAVIVGVVLALTSKDVLDQNAAQDGVKKVLTESYGAQDVTDVSCPADQEVSKDSTFTCTANVDGEQKKVTVTFTDDDGTYEVGRPS